MKINGFILSCLVVLAGCSTKAELDRARLELRVAQDQLSEAESARNVAVAASQEAKELTVRLQAEEHNRQAIIQLEAALVAERENSARLIQELEVAQMKLREAEAKINQLQK